LIQRKFIIAKTIAQPIKQVLESVSKMANHHTKITEKLIQNFLVFIWSFNHFKLVEKIAKITGKNAIKKYQ
jgi:hypothetical protein